VTDREAILDSAKYLRQVRPIDPEEVGEYVEGGAHPAVVRQVLREAAPSLDLVEREDGTFVPVADEPKPIRPGVETVERLPERYERRLEDRLVEAFGRDWHCGESGDRIRGVVRRLKEDYYRNRDVEYDRTVALGYAVYHLADYYTAVQYVLEELAARGLLERRLRVLDVGAGTGGPALGLFDYVDDADRGGSDPALVEYHAVEPGAGVDVLEAMLEETGPNVHATVHRETAEAFDPAGPLSEGEGWDLVLFANVLSELEAPVEVAERYLPELAGNGSLLALAPADRETSVGLRQVERSLSGRATVFAPTVRLWPGLEPSGTCWSFDERPELDPPAVQRRLQEGATDPEHDGEFLKTAVRFSYAILRSDGTRKYEFDPDPGSWARMADSDDHVTNRVDLLGVKLSRSLAEDGNPLFLVGDGSESVDHFAVLANETVLNRALLEAEYGEALSFESVLVLWNDDEAAYNLVVDDETVVDRMVG
jgi:SAM-dependent methyltransferase